MILVGGGSRSGKSAKALELLQKAGPRRGFIATAQVWDEEMRERIERHKTERGPDIFTWEEPFAVAELIAHEDGKYDAIMVDCLTLWLTNLMLAGTYSLEAECLKLVETCEGASTNVILVTNEVGCGIVPENALARRFRDEAGRLNQMAARHAKEVYWMIFGIGMRVK